MIWPAWMVLALGLALIVGDAVRMQVTRRQTDLGRLIIDTIAVAAVVIPVAFIAEALYLVTFVLPWWLCGVAALVCLVAGTWWIITVIDQREPYVADLRSLDEAESACDSPT